MIIKKTLKVVRDFFTQEDGPSIPPVQYRGFAKDYESFQKDRNKVAGDMQHGWKKPSSTLA